MQRPETSGRVEGKHSSCIGAWVLSVMQRHHSPPVPVVQGKLLTFLCHYFQGEPVTI